MSWCVLSRAIGHATHFPSGRVYSRPVGEGGLLGTCWANSQFFHALPARNWVRPLPAVGSCASSVLALPLVTVRLVWLLRAAVRCVPVTLVLACVGVSSRPRACVVELAVAAAGRPSFSPVLACAEVVLFWSVLSVKAATCTCPTLLPLGQVCFLSCVLSAEETKVYTVCGGGGRTPVHRTRAQPCEHVGAVLQVAEAVLPAEVGGVGT